MARINLLPWREWERERKQKEFLTNLVLVLATAGIGVYLWGMQLDTAVQNQNARNQVLNSEIAELDTKISEIRNLRQEKERLLARMRIIQDLQGNRPVIVRVFDEMVRTLSSGVHFVNVKMQEQELSVNGFAESNNRISSLMRNLDGSDWFARPNLKNIKEDPGNPNYGSQASRFDLTFQQVGPQQDEEEGE